jgi:hypothetical protein
MIFDTIKPMILLYDYDGWTQCEVCGKRIEITNNKIKYCEECVKEEWKKYNRDKQRQYYKLNSV